MWERGKEKILPWFEGPAFLLAEDYDFPVPPNAADNVRGAISSLAAISDVKNERKICCLPPCEKFVSFIKYYSEFDRLILALCYVFRAIKAYAIKNEKEKRQFLSLSRSPLSVKERNNAEVFAIRSVQKECFGGLYVYICLLNGGFVAK